MKQEDRGKEDGEATRRPQALDFSLTAHDIPYLIAYPTPVPSRSLQRTKHRPPPPSTHAPIHCCYWHLACGRRKVRVGSLLTRQLGVRDGARQARLESTAAQLSHVSQQQALAQLQIRYSSCEAALLCGPACAGSKQHTQSLISTLRAGSSSGCLSDCEMPWHDCQRFAARMHPLTILPTRARLRPYLSMWPVCARVRVPEGRWRKT